MHFEARCILQQPTLFKGFGNGGGTHWKAAQNFWMGLLWLMIESD
jgi:hypothetical protein